MVIAAQFIWLDPTDGLWHCNIDSHERIRDNWVFILIMKQFFVFDVIGTLVKSQSQQSLQCFRTYLPSISLPHLLLNHELIIDTFMTLHAIKCVVKSRKIIDTSIKKFKYPKVWAIKPVNLKKISFFSRA